MHSVSSPDRVARLVRTFRSRVGNDAPTLTTVQSVAWDYGRWAEERHGATRIKNADAEAKALALWWGTKGEAHLARWAEEAKVLTAAVSVAVSPSPVYWRTQYVPLVEYAKRTVDRFNEESTPIYPEAFQARAYLPVHPEPSACLHPCPHPHPHAGDERGGEGAQGRVGRRRARLGALHLRLLRMVP